MLLVPVKIATLRSDIASSMRTKNRNQNIDVHNHPTHARLLLAVNQIFFQESPSQTGSYSSATGRNSNQDLERWIFRSKCLTTCSSLERVQSIHGYTKLYFDWTFDCAFKMGSCVSKILTNKIDSVIEGVPNNKYSFEWTFRAANRAPTCNYKLP